MATLVATVTQLEATATDDALELLELLMATELAGRARQEANKETVKRHPRLARASAMLAVVAQVLLEARDWGSDGEVRVCQVWEAIEARIPRAEVRAAVDTVTGMLPPPEALPKPDWRAELAKKTHAVAGLCKMLTATITFGANAQGAPALAAMTALGGQLATEQLAGGPAAVVGQDGQAAQPFLDDVALGLGVHAPPGRVLGAEDGVGVRLAQSSGLVPPARQLLPADRGQPAHPAGPSRRGHPFHAGAGHVTCPGWLPSPAGQARTRTVVPCTRAASNKAVSTSAPRPGRSRRIQAYQLRVASS
jgi:hypothetical protein